MSYNAVFRNSSVFSNRQHQSKDIVRHCARQERVKHMFGGGYIPYDGWWHRATRELVYFADELSLGRQFGQDVDDVQEPGTFKVSDNKQPGQPD